MAGPMAPGMVSNSMRWYTKCHYLSMRFDLGFGIDIVKTSTIIWGHDAPIYAIKCC